MKLSEAGNYLPRLLILLSILNSAYSHSFANSLIAGGPVPEAMSLLVILSPPAAPGEDSAVSALPIEVATIEIDNNLPEYALALDFSDRYGGNDGIAEVTLDGLEGMLGEGLAAPNGTRLESGGAPGRFLWKPGRQESATVGYRIRVMVTYQRHPAHPQLLVGMPGLF
jgi:hypothetical protein